MDLNRRRMLQSGLALPLAAGASAATSGDSIYRKLGVRTFINAYGTLTTLGGTLMEPEVKRAMEEASRHFVAIHDLPVGSSVQVLDMTGRAVLVTAVDGEGRTSLSTRDLPHGAYVVRIADATRAESAPFVK